MADYVTNLLSNVRTVVSDTLVRIGEVVTTTITDHPLAVAPFALSGAVCLVTYVAPLLLQNLVLDHFGSNLKIKYNAEWALVTGASSGNICSYIEHDNMHLYCSQS